MPKRRVEDILDLCGPVAYVIDHEARVHRAVCPWCARDIGEPWSIPVGITVGQLYEWLLGIIGPHVLGSDCQWATEMQVYTEDRRKAVDKH